CNLFDSEGNALIWFKNGSELQSIRADDERVKYKATYQFNVGNSQVGSYTAYEVSEMWIALDSGKISNGNIVVLNLMDDDVLVNEASNNSYLNKPVNCLKTIAWANKVLEYAFLRLDTAAIQQQAFNGCDKLKYVNLEDLTELRQIGGSQTFGGCPNLFSGKTLDLTGTKLCAISGSGAFNGVPIAEFKLPSTVTSLGEWNFQNTAITSFLFFESVKTIPGSTFKWCANLTTIYIGSNTTSIGGDAFLDTNNLQNVFFVGTKAELEALVANTNATGNSTFLSVIETSMISYAEYLALEDKSGKYAVYDYSYCMAYNGGVHTNPTVTEHEATCETGAYTEESCTCGVETVTEPGAPLGHNHDVANGAVLSVVYASFLESGSETIRCSRCDNTTEPVTLAPILVNLGYTCQTFGENKHFGNGFIINRDALEYYEGANGKATIGFGFISATKLASIDALSLESFATYFTTNDTEEEFSSIVYKINVGSNEAYLDAQIAIIAFVQDAEGNLAFEQNTEDTGLDLVNGYKVVSYNKAYELSLEGEQEEVVQ
ncbi:MAG: leucine-rich repeat domain-containing protein, partial [Clostridia bacterium]|nr:leucine-rich repeat domain-containing protein [Clostridia bacterium]